MLTCECADPGCPHCKGECSGKAVECLVRIDMEDRTGTPMCEKCANDAMSAGVFRSDVGLFVKAKIAAGKETKNDRRADKRQPAG